MMDIKRMINNFHWFYWQFQLITMTHMMDSFEWWLFHSLLFFTVILLVYIFYVIVPMQFDLVLETVCHLFGLQCKSSRPAIIWICYTSQGLCGYFSSGLYCWVSFQSNFWRFSGIYKLNFFDPWNKSLGKNHNNYIQQVPKHRFSVWVSYLMSGMSYTHLNFSKEAYLSHF